jgi:hypothetical protein
MSITALPKPDVNLYGVYHFPEDHCCLLTVAPETILERFPGTNMNQVFPQILGDATSFAVYYNMDELRQGVMPDVLVDCLLSIENLHLNKCSIHALRHMLMLIRNNQGALLSLKANVTNFFAGPANHNDVNLLKDVMRLAVEMKIEFVITAAVSYSVFVEGRAQPQFSEGCEQVLAAVDEIYPLDALEFSYKAHTSREEGARELFTVYVDPSIGRFRNPAHHVMHFYNNNDGFRRLPTGDYFRAFANLNFVMQKTFSTWLTYGERKNNPQNLEARGEYLNQEFVIFADISGNYRPNGLDDVNIDPLWVDEVSAFLGLQVYVDGFGSQHARKDALARMWHVTKTLYQMSAAFNSHIIPCVLFKFMYE